MDSRYEQEVKQYGKKDTVIALCAFLASIVGIELLRILPIDWSVLPSQLRFLIPPIQQFIMQGVLVIIIILFMQQGFASIGIHKENLRKALCLGLIFSLIPLIFGIMPGIFYNGEFAGLEHFMLWVIRLSLIAVAEDILFVGFIQTRLFGVFKSNKMAIGIGAVLFSLMHVPPWLSTGQLSLDNLGFFGFMLIYWSVMHCMLVAVYRRYNSLIPVTILHIFINLMISPSITWIIADEYMGYAESLAMTAPVVLIIAVGIWAFIRHHRAQKANTIINWQ